MIHSIYSSKTLAGIVSAFCVSLAACSSGGSSESKPVDRGSEQGPPATEDVPSSPHSPGGSGTVTPAGSPLCKQEALPEFYGDQSYSVGPITASFYSEADGDVSGEGNDGSDAAIVPELRHTEVVEHIYLSSEWEVEGIDAWGFHAVWQGEITVEQDRVTILAELSQSWSDTSVYVNDELVRGPIDCSLSIPLELDRGTHTFRVEHHNHYFVTGFSLTFSDYPRLEGRAVKEAISSTATDFTQVLVVSGGAPKAADGVVTVTLPETVESAILVLTSSEPTLWRIENPHNISLEAVLIDSQYRGAKVVNLEAVPIYRVSDLPYSVEQLDATVRAVEELTGFSPIYLNAKRDIADLVINSSTNMLDSNVWGKDVVVLDNHHVFQLKSISATSEEGGQQVASHFYLEKETAITRLEWAGMLSANLFNGDSVNAGTVRSRPFLLRIYTGVSLPSHLYIEKRIDVDAEERLEIDRDVLHYFTYQDENIATLMPGHYWASLVEPQYENLGFRWILDGDPGLGEAGQGGAFRDSPEGFWRSTAAGAEATNAPAGNMVIRGVEVWGRGLTL